MQFMGIFRTYRTHSVNVACASNTAVNSNISHLSEYLKDKTLNTGVKKATKNGRNVDFKQGEKMDLLYQLLVVLWIHKVSAMFKIE